MPHDLLHAWRANRRSPVSTVVIILLMAMAIGATTAIFTVTDALLLRPLPVREPGQLVQMFFHQSGLVEPEFPDRFCQRVLEERPGAFLDLACETPLSVAVASADRVERRNVAAVSANYYRMLGVEARLGRLPEPAAEPGQPVAILSDAFWREWFDADPAALGQTLRISGRPFVIAGVEPPEFHGIQADTGPDVRITRAGQDTIAPRDPSVGTWVFGRTAPGTPLDAARDQALAIWAEPRPPDPTVAAQMELRPIPRGYSRLRDQFGGAVTVLLAGVVALLLIACANAAGLLMARTAARRSELAVRAAIGASRVQLLRQLGAECALLIAAAGALGMALAYTATPLLAAAIPPTRDLAAILHPIQLDLTPDARALLFSLALCALTVVLCSLAPGLETARTSAREALVAVRATARTGVSRGVLIAVQVALCTVLLAGAGLLVRTFASLRALDPGFDAARIATFSLDPRLSGHDPESADQLERRLLEEVRALPGVESAAYGGRALMRGTGVKSRVGPAGSVIDPNGELNSSLNAVSLGYFETLGIPLVAGRNFTERDRDAGPVARVIVSQAFVRRFYPDRDPLGQRFGYPGQDGVAQALNEIIGVAGDAKYRSLREELQPVYYLFRETDPREITLHVRSSGAPAAIVAPVVAALRSLDPELAFFEIHTLAEEVEVSLWRERLIAWLASVFALLAAALAGIGVYGTLAYAVAGRRREIGIRMALGAFPAAIARLVSRQALVPVAAGLILGFAGVWAGSQSIAALLYSVKPSDPTALAGSLLFVVTVAIAAAAIPARQAIRVDPAQVLRNGDTPA